MALNTIYSQSMTQNRTLKRAALIASVIVAAPAFSAAALAESRSYDVAEFSAVKASTGVKVNIVQGDTPSVNATGEDGKMDRLSVTTENGLLRIRVTKKKGGWGWGGRTPSFTVDVVTPTLKSIDVSSGADVDAQNITADDFVLDSSSGASIDISGTCSRVSADASSGSDIDADNFVCQSAIADVSSGASIDIHATETFSGDASSGGSINVYGKPTDVTSDRSSGGSVRIR